MMGPSGSDLLGVARDAIVSSTVRPCWGCCMETDLGRWRLRTIRETQAITTMFGGCLCCSRASFERLLAMRVHGHHQRLLGTTVSGSSRHKTPLL